MISWPTLKLTTELIRLWYWPKNRHINQWKRIESPEIDTYIYSQLILTMMPGQFNGEQIIFSTNDAGSTGYPCAKE